MVHNCPNIRKDLLQSDIDQLIEECCFTEEYAVILKMLVGKASYIQIADTVGVSAATVGRRIREIKEKVNIAYDRFVSKI